jgi:hypothetical protein
MHGTRYSLFECAICTPATAAKQALAAGAAGNAAAALAYLVGSQASPVVQERARAALGLVVSDSHRQIQGAEDRRSVVAPRVGDPNLISNLADVIRGIDGSPQAFVPAVRTPGQGAEPMEGAVPGEPVPVGGAPAGVVSIDAVGGAVREAFTGNEFLEPTGHAAMIAAGSLLLAYSLADETVAAWRRDHPAYWPGLEYRLPAPWQVSHPVLLDPVMWMVGTAYLMSGNTQDAR